MVKVTRRVDNGYMDRNLLGYFIDTFYDMYMAAMSISNPFGRDYTNQANTV